MKTSLRERNTTGQAHSEKGSAEPAQVRRIALIGNHSPRRCGIATFTSDIHLALRARYPDVAIDVYAMDDPGNRHDYPPAVVHSIDEQSPAAYLEAARRIEASGADLVWLQHEYGIFGGDAGEMILTLLDRISMPIAVTLHTVLEAPTAAQRQVMDRIVRMADRLVVMADKGRDTLMRVHGARAGQISVIPHGIPDRPFAPTAPMKAKLGLDGHDVILTFGLLSPGKGIETMIDAMPAIVERFPQARYVVLGATHPHLVAQEGEAYRDRLKALAEARGVAANIQWVDAFLETDDLLDWLTAADIYVTPYLNPAQVTSGTLSYAVGLGKPVVSTPYVHAAELLGNGDGRLVPFGDSQGFAAEIVSLLADPHALADLRRRSYARGRTMVWSSSAEQHMTVFRPLAADRVRRQVGRLFRQTRPEVPAFVSFDAIERLSDSTGMLQHSLYSIPDRDHGYCVDDNARALLLTNRHEQIDDATYDRLTPVYASFVQHAWNAEAGSFRNFMSFDRRWLEERGSEDSFGRTLWSLGVTARDARRPQFRRWATSLFDQVALHALELGSPRARAFAILGGAAMLEAHPGHLLSLRILREFGADLMKLLDDNVRPDWAWFEIVLAYDNCRLPEALLRAGRSLADPQMVKRGIETMDWIVGQQTNAHGHFRAVGSESFGRPLQPPLPFDQQPLEAWATIDACDAAFEATGDFRWREVAMTAYRWFGGENDLGLALANAESGECYDGLMPGGVNYNQGAESVLAFHLATCSIRKLCGVQQTGRSPEVAAA